MPEEADMSTHDKIAMIATSNTDIILQTPTLEVTVRGKKIKLALGGIFGINESPPHMWWVFCMLQLNNPEIDRLLCEMKIIVTDADNQLVFDWQKGGWIQ